MTARNDYAEDKADADELIDEFGQDGALRRQSTSGPAYNPVVTTTDHDCIFAVIDYESREIDGTRILATDKKVLLAKGDLTIEPTTSDKLLTGGVSHSIIRVEPLAPGGVTVLWTLQCRR